MNPVPPVIRIRIVAASPSARTLASAAPGDHAGDCGPGWCGLNPCPNQSGELMSMAQQALPGVRVEAPAIDGAERVLTGDALAFLADLERRFRAERQRLLARGSSGRRASTPASCPTSCPRPAHPRRRLDGRADPGRPAGPPRRDHRAGRPQDGHQRAQLAAPTCFMADFEDATSPTWANLIEGQLNLRDAVRRADRLRRSAERQGVPAERRAPPCCWCARAAGTSTEKHVMVDGEPMSGSLFDFGLYFFHNAKELLARGSGPVLLPAEDGEPSRGAAVERRLRARAGRARHPARHDQGHGADRDHPRRLRDGRDPLRAARPLGGPELRPLGLHLQLHQEAREHDPTVVLPDRGAGDDDRALPARLLRSC